MEFYYIFLEGCRVDRVGWREGGRLRVDMGVKERDVGELKSVGWRGDSS